jgi:hypothetical protein
MKKNAELKIEYLSQENDHDLLLSQVLQQKNDFKRLKTLAEEVRAKALAQGLTQDMLDQAVEDQQLENQDANTITKKIMEKTAGVTNNFFA